MTYLPRLGVEFGARASASISRGSRRTLTICRGGLQTGASAASQAHGRVPAVFIEAHHRGKTSAEVRKGRFTVCFLTSSIPFYVWRSILEAAAIAEELYRLETVCVE